MIYPMSLTIKANATTESINIFASVGNNSNIIDPTIQQLGQVNDGISYVLLGKGAHDQPTNQHTNRWTDTTRLKSHLHGTTNGWTL